MADPEPMEGRWTKKRAGFVAAGVLVVAAALNAGGEEPPTPQAADTTLPVANSTSSSVTTTMATTSTSTATTTTVEATTTTTRAVPFPEQEHADVIFAPVTAGAAGDPEADPPSGATEAIVASITDGDTIRVRLSNGSTEPLRIIGINSPERGECFAAEAAAVLEWLAPVGSTVWLTRDRSDRDQYDRLLRHVWVGGLNVGEEILRRGAALARDYPPDTSMSSRFRAAQEHAREMGLGLWAKDACGPSAGYDLTVVELQADAPGNDHENLNGEYVVIRNNGAMGVDLTGWVLKDESASHRYQFPAGFVLGAGASVAIHTGCGADGAATLYWCSSKGAVWNNDGDTAFLLDHHGNVVHSLAWAAPVTTTTRPSTTTTKPKPSKTGGGGGGNCDPSYPTVCIPPHPPDLDCGDIPHRRFRVLPPDPHGFDRDNDGIGCES